MSQPRPLRDPLATGGTRRLGSNALYLGYWIRNCRKINYKTQYRPIERFVNQRWTLLT